MLNRLILPRLKPWQVKCLSTTTILRCQKPKNSEGKKSGTEEEKIKNEIDEFPLKEVRANSTAERNKLFAKQKLNILIRDMEKSTSDSKSSLTKVQVPQPIKKKIKTTPRVSTASFQQNLLMAMKNVANELGGNAAETETDLLQSLTFMKVSKDNKESQETKLLDREVSVKLKNILENIEKFDNSKNMDFNLHFNEDLEIFHSQKNYQSEVIQLKIWDDLEKEELQSLSTTPPRNYYEELILWTNQGKLWHFPIDNDQGLDKEADIDFTEHVFLEDHLESWCPKKGPLRHFMELVLVGLSKNPYLSVQDKKEHINWFKDYFENKKKLLAEVGALALNEEEEKPEKFLLKEKN